MSEENKATVRRFYAAVNNDDLSVIDEVFADNYVEHMRMPAGVAPGKAGVPQFMMGLKASFTGMQLEPTKVLGDGDLVSLLVILKGTHTGEFLGIPPTGKEIAVPVIDIARLEDGKIAEHWGFIDHGELAQQLGIG